MLSIESHKEISALIDQLIIPGAFVSFSIPRISQGFEYTTSRLSFVHNTIQLSEFNVQKTDAEHSIVHSMS